VTEDILRLGKFVEKGKI